MLAYAQTDGIDYNYYYMKLFRKAIRMI
jgi:hypothetical protein